MKRAKDQTKTRNNGKGTKVLWMIQVGTEKGNISLRIPVKVAVTSKGQDRYTYTNPFFSV